MGKRKHQEHEKEDSEEQREQSEPELSDELETGDEDGECSRSHAWACVLRTQPQYALYHTYCQHHKPQPYLRNTQQHTQQHQQQGSSCPGRAGPAQQLLVLPLPH
jgi:hypothetical protein